MSMSSATTLWKPPTFWNISRFMAKAAPFTAGHLCMYLDDSQELTLNVKYS